MRIRVAHVNQRTANPRQTFKYATHRKLAWLTGASDKTGDVVFAAANNGYLCTILDGSPFWVAVREDLIQSGNWDTSSGAENVFAAFKATTPGLGEVLIAAGEIVDAKDLGESLGFDLVFYGGIEDGEIGIGFYDRDGRVQKLRSSPQSSNQYLEAIITI